MTSAGQLSRPRLKGPQERTCLPRVPPNVRVDLRGRGGRHGDAVVGRALRPPPAPARVHRGVCTDAGAGGRLCLDLRGRTRLVRERSRLDEHRPGGAVVPELERARLVGRVREQVDEVEREYAARVGEHEQSEREVAENVRQTKRVRVRQEAANTEGSLARRHTRSACLETREHPLVVLVQLLILDPLELGDELEDRLVVFLAAPEVVERQVLGVRKLVRRTPSNASEVDQTHFPEQRHVRLREKVRLERATARSDAPVLVHHDDS